MIGDLRPTEISRMIDIWLVYFKYLQTYKSHSDIVFLILPTGFTGFFPRFFHIYSINWYHWHRFPSTLHIPSLPAPPSSSARPLMGAAAGVERSGFVTAEVGVPVWPETWLLLWWMQLKLPWSKVSFCEFEIWRSMLWGSFTKLTSYYYYYHHHYYYYATWLSCMTSFGTPRNSQMSPSSA